MAVACDEDTAKYEYTCGHCFRQNGCAVVLCRVELCDSETLANLLMHCDYFIIPPALIFNNSAFCHMRYSGFWYSNLGTMEVVLQRLLNGMVLTLRSLEFIKVIYQVSFPGSQREQRVRYKYPSVNAVNPKNCMKAITPSGGRVRNFRMLNQA